MRSTCFLVAPKLNLGTLQNIRVRAGQPINLNVEFDGEPAPSISWTINNQSFNGTNHINLENKEHLSQISIASSLRSDTGIYSISVNNEFGNDSGKCSVVVLDAPGIPEGPLKPTNIHKEGCTLQWKPPTVFISIYN